ncbi:MAG: hypothetical protein ACJ77B_03740, partial [Chloroflexota bacterium]
MQPSPVEAIETVERQTPADPPPGPASDRAELRSSSWTRIQWHLRLALPRDPGSDPPEFGLRGPGFDGVVPPAAVETAGTDVVIRINVMQGPRRLPLGNGRWRVVAVEAGAVRPLIVDGPARSLDGALWQLGEGEYRALPAVDADGSVLLDVELDPSVRRPRAPAPVTKRLKRFAKRRIKWVLRPVRRAVFRGVFRLARLTDRRHRKRILF